MEADQIIKDLLAALESAVALAPRRDGYGGFKEVPRQVAYPEWAKINDTRRRATEFLKEVQS